MRLINVLCANAEALVKPLRYYGSQMSVWKCVVICSAVAAVVASPQAVVFQQIEDSVTNSTQNATHDVVAKCVSAGYTAQWQRKAYVAFFTMYMVIVPAIIMGFCYGSVIYSICSRRTQGAPKMML